jgi:hypothetical protein
MSWVGRVAVLHATTARARESPDLHPGTLMKPSGMPPATTVACEICDTDYGVRRQRRVVQKLQQ